MEISDDDFYTTVRKFQDFSVIQILREMDCEGTTFERSKTASFCHFRALNLDNLVNFSLQKVQKSIKNKIQSL